MQILPRLLTLSARIDSPAIATLPVLLKILVVEDHQDTAVVMQHMLTAAGYSVSRAVSVASAIEAVGREKFDVIIIDIGLPDGDGISLLQAVRKLSDASAIALTGYGMREDIERCYAGGFSKHLTKPVTLDTLVETIASVYQSNKK